MRVFDPVSIVLGTKSKELWTVPPDATVYSAIEMMAQKHVGSLLVIDQSVLVGIITERDYARKVILMGRSSKDTFVREIMSTSVVTVHPDCTVDEAMRVMTVHRIRHLPVIKDGGVVGMISIGDLVNWIIFTQDKTIEQLEHFITGQYPC